MGYEPKFIYGSLKDSPVVIPVFSKIFEFFFVTKKVYKEKADIVIANSPTEAYIFRLISKISFKKNIPYVCFMHGSFFQFTDDILKYSLIHRNDFQDIWLNDKEYQKIIPYKRPKSSFRDKIKAEIKALILFYGARGARVIFVLSDRNYKIIKCLYHHNNIVVLHGAFSNKLLVEQKYNNIEGKSLSDSPVIFSLCRLVSKKRVDVIIRAFALFLSDFPNARLIIGGTGEEFDKLVQLSSDLNIKNSVEFTGFIEENNLEKYYLLADIFVSADIADYDITTITALAYNKLLIVPEQHEFDAEFGNVFKSGVSPEQYYCNFLRAANTKLFIDIECYKRKLLEYTWEYYFKHIGIILSDIIESKK